MAAAVGVFLLVGGGSSGTFRAQAQSICTDSQAAIKRLEAANPTSLTQALQAEHSLLSAYGSEIKQLQSLRPTGAGASGFEAGLNDDTALLSGLTSIMARPDYVQLAMTVPDDPALAPAWLTAWLTREQTLEAQARTGFQQADIPACRVSLGS